MYKVLIVEDQNLARKSLEAEISENDNYEVTGMIANASLAEVFCMSNDVDIIIMDVCTEDDESGIKAAAIIKKNMPEIKIIIVTSMAEYTFLKQAKAAQVDSFWYKDHSNENLISIMDRTMNGESIFPKKTPEVQLGKITSYSLTKSELNTLKAVMESSNYKEAADKLCCTERTIRFHITNILEKTGYRSRFELCMAVAKKGLIIPD